MINYIIKKKEGTEHANNIDGSIRQFSTSKAAHSFLALIKATSQYWNKFDVYFTYQEKKVLFICNPEWRVTDLHQDIVWPIT